jgi:hypothetical protein
MSVVLCVASAQGFFLLMLWMVPFSFFISLSVNDNVLPSTTPPTGRGEEGAGTGPCPLVEHARSKGGEGLVAGCNPRKPLSLHAAVVGGCVTLLLLIWGVLAMMVCGRGGGVHVLAVGRGGASAVEA